MIKAPFFKSTQNLVIIALIAVCALSRLLPHPPNFSPIEATALFAGAYLSSRWLSVLVPLAAMALSDLFLGWHDGLWLVYLCIAGIAFAGAFLATRITALKVFSYAVSSAVAFFLITNAFVWLSSGMYPYSAAGLIACYTAAIPFFHNQLAGVVIYSTLLFGSWHLLQLRFFAPMQSTK